MADYHISPSILDKFQRCLDYESSWDQFYGKSDEPQYSIQEWYDKLEQELIDAVNGVPTPSTPAADLGTCLNEAIDCIILNVPSTRKDVFLQSSIVGYDGTNDIPGVIAVKEDNKFLFHTEDVVNLATWFKGMKVQQMVSAEIETSNGIVEIYGYPDYYNDEWVVDLKTTRNYTCGNYRHHWQRYAYPYILSKRGEIGRYKGFVFHVCKVSGNNTRNPFVELEATMETYTDPIGMLETPLREITNQFLEWYKNAMKATVCRNRLCGSK